MNNRSYIQIYPDGTRRKVAYSFTAHPKKKKKHKYQRPILFLGLNTTKG